MKKLLLGLAAGVMIMMVVGTGIELYNEIKNLNTVQQQEIDVDAMKLSWYEYHHDTLSEALEQE